MARLKYLLGQTEAHCKISLGRKAGLRV